MGDKFEEGTERKQKKEERSRESITKNGGGCPTAPPIAMNILS